MPMIIKKNEASPRKFRAEPTSRGVGGKWGPARGADSSSLRSQSVKQWREKGFQDDLFKDMLNSGLAKAGLSNWSVYSSSASADKDTVCIHAACSDDNKSFYGISYPDYCVKVTDTTVQGIDNLHFYKGNVERLLQRICVYVADTYGVDLIFVPNRDSGWVVCEIKALLSDDPYDSTRKDEVDLLVGAMVDVDKYLKSMANAVKREASRTFHESKCSMQKRIESFRK